jgi:hypothetical protein
VASLRRSARRACVATSQNPQPNQGLFGLIPRPLHAGNACCYGRATSHDPRRRPADCAAPIRAGAKPARRRPRRLCFGRLGAGHRGAEEPAAGKREHETRHRDGFAVERIRAGAVIAGNGRHRRTAAGRRSGGRGVGVGRAEPGRSHIRLESRHRSMVVSPVDRFALRRPDK